MEQVIFFSQVVATGFKLYGWLIMAAFVLSWLDADPSNRAVQFVHRSTQPFWGWIAAKLPYQYSSYAPIAALFAIDFGEIFFPGLIRSVGSLALGGSDLVQSVVNVLVYAGLSGLVVGRSILFFVMIIALAYLVISIIAPPMTNPLVRNIIWLIDPVITPLQRILPRTKIDLSPVVLAAGLYFTLQFLAPLTIELQSRLTV